jgi:hypothetical protein
MEKSLSIAWYLFELSTPMLFLVQLRNMHHIAFLLYLEASSFAYTRISLTGSDVEVGPCESVFVQIVPGTVCPEAI